MRFAANFFLPLYSCRFLIKIYLYIINFSRRVRLSMKEKHTIVMCKQMRLLHFQTSHIGMTEFICIFDRLNAWGKGRKYALYNKNGQFNLRHTKQYVHSLCTHFIIMVHFVNHKVLAIYFTTKTTTATDLAWLGFVLFFSAFKIVHIIILNSNFDGMHKSINGSPEPWSQLHLWPWSFI